MAQPERTAQGNCLGPMYQTRPLVRLICPNLLAIFVMAGALIAGACGAGESGLVLGSPQAEGGSGGTGSVVPDGGSGEPLVLGGEPGAAGSSGAPNDPTWISDACTPALAFENRDTTSQGQLFTDAIPDPSEPVWAAAHAACRLLYRSADEVKTISKLSLIVEDYDGIAFTQGTTIHLSTRYLKTAADRGIDLRQEITGILHFNTSLVYQNSGSDADTAPPGWLIVGIADYVRLESGYIDRSERAKGGSYDGSGSQTTAFFLDYLATKNAAVVMQLNQRLAQTSAVWTNDVFKTLLGSDVDTLWASYQATL
jgi:Peptidase of plants and bacteria